MTNTEHSFSYIMAVSIIGGGNRSIRRKTLTCRKSLTNFITQCCIEQSAPCAGFELTTLVVIGSVCTGSCKSNYHTIMTTTAPKNKEYSTSVIQSAKSNSKRNHVIITIQIHFYHCPLQILTISHFFTITKLPNQKLAIFRFMLLCHLYWRYTKQRGQNIITKSCLIQIELLINVLQTIMLNTCLSAFLTYL